MAVTLNVQSDAGDVANANGYVDVSDFKDYCDMRGYDYSSYTDDQIKQAIIRATDYIDTRFAYNGIKLLGLAQTTEYPRDNLTNRDGVDCSAILPVPVTRACVEYSFRALSTALYTDAPPPEDGRPILSQTKTMGPMTEATTFVSEQIMTIVLGEYPAADRLLFMAGFVRSQSRVDR